MYTESAIGLVLMTLAYPYLHDRYEVLRWGLITNRPSNLHNVSTFSSYEVKFKDQLRNCEDTLLNEEEGFAILSCDPGRDRWNTVLGLFIDPGITTGSLYYYDYTSPSGLPHPMPPQKFPHDLGADFHPLGMEFDSKTSRLYVVNHAAAGSRIDVLTLSATSSTPSLTYLSTIKHPLLRTPNSITQLSDHELYITNDHYFKIRDNKLLALAETYLAIPGGSVAYVNTETNEVRKVASLPFANGITVLNDTTLAVASTTRPGLYIYSIDPISRALTKKQTIKLTFSVDNLSIDKNGKVLMAGHPHFPSLAAVAKTNHRYDFAVQEIDDVRPRAPSWVADWDGNEVKDLHVGSEYGTACTAVRDTKAGVVIVTGLYERGILVARETK